MIKELTDKDILLVCKRILVHDIDIALDDLHIFHINDVRNFINSVKYHYDLKRMSIEDYKKVDGYKIEFCKERWLLFISNVGYEEDLNYIHESFERWDHQKELNDLRERVKNTIKLFDENEEKKQKQVKAGEEIVKSDGTKFKLKEIAYLHFYNNEPISKDNKNEVAKKYGWASGHSLIQDYNDTIKRLDTKDISKTVLKNRIEIIKEIIPYLKTEKQGRPKDELTILEKNLEDKRDW